MASSVFLLKLHHGLTRPAIAAMIPTLKHPVVLVDAGANVDCSAEELVQFARLGSVYAEDILDAPRAIDRSAEQRRGSRRRATRP